MKTMNRDSREFRHFPGIRQLAVGIVLGLPALGQTIAWGQPAISPIRPPRTGRSTQVFGPTLNSRDPRAAAGSPNPASRGPKTEISVELLTGEEGVGYSAHRWYQMFERLQIPLIVRHGESGEELDTTESGSGLAGATRKVRVRGKLDKNGTLVFSDRSFTEAQAGQLARWLRDLQEFGAQGSPKGQPIWGLTKDQFTALFTALSEPVSGESADKSLSEALTALTVPRQYPLTYSTEASRYRIDSIKEAIPVANEEEITGGKVRQSVTGVAKGTALAVVLSEYGLGFRPRRLADGKIELQICTQTERPDLWPVGWPQQASNPKTAPKYYALMKIDLHDLMLDEVLNAAADLIGMPILVDYYALAAKKIDLSKVKVSHPPKQTTWSLALQQLTFQAKAQVHLYIDEAGRPFVWVTPVGTIRKTKASGGL